MADESIPVRLSHLLRHCSVGAIVRGPESLMVVPDIRSWGSPSDNPLEREIRYVDQVRSALGIDERLCRPPIAKKRVGWTKGWIRALRFPGWMRCLTCGLLHRKPWTDQERSSTDCWGTGPMSEQNSSRRCRGQLEQVPWVLVHKEGYLADVPWHHLAHAGTRDRRSEDCLPDWKEPPSGAGRSGEWNGPKFDAGVAILEARLSPGIRIRPALGSSPGYRSRRPRYPKNPPG